MSDFAIFIAFWAGFACAWLLYRKPPVTKIIVDDEVLRQINLEYVNAWLDKHDMTWQPKGAVFNPGRKVPKCPNS